MSGSRPVLVFDADCAFCTACVDFLRRRIHVDAEIVGWQFTDLDALGLTQKQCEESVQWVEGGRIWSGHAAIGRLLVYKGGLWKVPGVIMLVPPCSWVARGVYRLIAKNRDRMPGGTAACALPQAERDKLRHG